MLRTGRRATKHLVHLSLRAPCSLGMFSKQKTPPQQRGGSGFMTGLEADHALVEDFLLRQRLTGSFVAQCKQHVQQVGARRIAATARLSRIDVALYESPQYGQCAAFVGLSG